MTDRGVDLHPPVDMHARVAPPLCRLLLGVCAASASACDGDPPAGSGSATTDTDGPSGGDTDGGDPNPTDPTDPTDPDPSGAASTGDAPPSGLALSEDVLLFVRATDSSSDTLWAYDVASDAAEPLPVFDDGTEIRAIAIHPTRTSIAVASDFESIDYQASETIHSIAIDADGSFTAPGVLMPPFPAPIGVSTGYRQQISDMQWHPDGSALWFNHSFMVDISTPGGGGLGWVDGDGGEGELFVDALGDCTVNTGPAPRPDGAVVLAVQAVCIDGTHEGVVAFDVPPAGAPDVVVPAPDAVFDNPEWIPDGSGVVFGATIDYDGDGDGTAEQRGDALLLLDVATGAQHVLLAPTPESYLWSFAMAPDALRFAVCISQGGGQNLLLVDYSGEEPTTRWLTDDGVSCDPEW